MNVAQVSCLCPGTPHAGDTITFHERLGFRQVVHFQKSVGWFRDQSPDADVPETLAFLSEWYLLNCIASWTLLDAKSKPLPVSKANVEGVLMADTTAALAAAEVADELYTEMLLLPLADKASNSSRPTRTATSTSATPGSGATRTRSRRSSTTNTQTAAIATM